MVWKWDCLQSVPFARAHYSKKARARTKHRTRAYCKKRHAFLTDSAPPL